MALQGGSLALATGVSCIACQPSLSIGTWECAGSAYGGASSTALPATPEMPLVLPWRTGFENGFCGFAPDAGFCYASPDASYELVREPVHSGTFAAAFNVVGDPLQDGRAARCARQGRLPEAAYYGAWFFVPTVVTASEDWTLFRFDGDSAAVEHGLWDVSLVPSAPGELQVYVFDSLRMTTTFVSEPGIARTGRWFHIEVFLQRSAEPDGTFELYIDGERVFVATNIATDDSEIGQWYVGNLAASLTPRQNTLYVDDITISAERQGVP